VIFQEKSDGEKEHLSKPSKIKEEIELQHGTKRESRAPIKSERHSTSKRLTQLEQNSLLTDTDLYLSAEL